MKPAVTLLLPNYNGARFLPESIPALLRQTYPHFRLVVVDNGSTDESEAVVRGFADERLRFVAHAEHVPVCSNFRRAQALVDTPFYTICAGDEVYEPGWLAAMMELLERRPDAFMACCKCDSADENGRIFLAGHERYKAGFWPREEPALFVREKHVAEFIRGDFLIITGCVFRRSATDVIGPINEHARFTGDWEYWVRGLLAGYTIVGTHRPLVHYRRHARMTTRKLTHDFSRFHDELAMIRWITEVAWGQGLIASRTPDFRLVRNTLLHEFGDALAAGNDAGADALLAFGAEHIPGFRGSFFHRLAQAARRLGRAGGMALQSAEKIYLRLWSLASVFPPLAGEG